MSNIQLKDTCNWLLGEGILSYLTTNFDVPWKTEITDGSDLDLDYYGNHSGDKIVSNLTEKLLDTNNKLTTLNTAKLAAVIFKKYNREWGRTWEVLHKEYDPLTNYDLYEKESPAETTRTITPAETTTTTKVPETTTTITPAEIKTETKVAEVNKEITTPETTTTIKTPETTTTIKTPETTTTTKVPEQTTTSKPALVKTTTENDIYGFDSNGASHDGKQTVIPQLISGGNGEEKIEQGTKAGEQKVEQGTKAGEQKVEQGLNAGEEKVVQGQKAGTENVTQGTHPGEETIEVLTAGEEKVEQGTKAGEEQFSVDTAGTEVYTTQTERELTRSGNIGIRSNQELILQELELAEHNFFDTIVYPQLDKILCMSYYKDTVNGLY